MSVLSQMLFNNIEKEPITIRTNYRYIDKVLGGGIPLGDIIEFYGECDIGKTTIGCQLLNSLIKEDNIGIYLDLEHSIDADYLKQLGIDLDTFLIGHPSNAEETFELISYLIKLRTKTPIFIILDSILALIPREEIENPLAQNTTFLQYEIVCRYLNKIAREIKDSNVTLILFNQVKEKIGRKRKLTTVSNRPIKVYSSIRIRIERMYSLKIDGFEKGSKIKFINTKNIYSIPYSEVTYDFEFNRGLSKSGELLDYLIELGVVKKNNSWYYIDGRKQQGRENAKLEIEKHFNSFA